MTRTPERYLHAARLKWRATHADTFTATCWCGRTFNPRKGAACSTTCIDELAQRRARSA